LRVRSYRVAMMAESDLDQRISPVYTRYTDVATTVLAAPGDIQIHLRARCESAERAEALLEEVGSQVEAILGDWIYARSMDPLEAVVGEALRARGATLSVAESCTGGLVGHRITSIAGSSTYFLGGFLTYSDAMKTELLGVPEDLLRQHTAISEPVAQAMALGAQQRARSTYALSITGLADPGNGTIYIGLAGPAGVQVHHVRYLGDRDRIRTLAAQMALDILRRALTT